MLVQLLCQEFARQLLPENPKVKLLSMLHKFMLFAQKPIYTINQESCATDIHVITKRHHLLQLIYQSYTINEQYLAPIM
jgi:hypothetical protein